jgi:hypothetical protein
MALRNSEVRPRVSGDRTLQDGQAGGSIERNEAEPSVGRLVDSYGHVHSEAIFLNWSPAAIVAFGIRRLGGA